MKEKPGIEKNISMNVAKNEEAQEQKVAWNKRCKKWDQCEHGQEWRNTPEQKRKELCES